MSMIDLAHPHHLDPAAHALVDDIAAGLARRYGITAAWRGDTLHFRRTGLDGSIAVGAAAIRVTARLGLLLAALQPAIEREIRAELARRLGG